MGRRNPWRGRDLCSCSVVFFFGGGDIGIKQALQKAVPCVTLFFGGEGCNPLDSPPRWASAVFSALASACKVSCESWQQVVLSPRQGHFQWKGPKIPDNKKQKVGFTSRYGATSSKTGRLWDAFFY